LDGIVPSMFYEAGLCNVIVWLSLRNDPFFGLVSWMGRSNFMFGRLDETIEQAAMTTVRLHLMVLVDLDHTCIMKNSHTQIF
jgi:hypothetical protein